MQEWIHDAMVKEYGSFPSIMVYFIRWAHNTSIFQDYEVLVAVTQVL
jgi:hypothetical protein